MWSHEILFCIMILWVNILQCGIHIIYHIALEVRLGL